MNLFFAEAEIKSAARKSPLGDREIVGAPKFLQAHFPIYCQCFYCRSNFGVIRNPQTLTEKFLPP
jgi:hypothetical protein